MVKSRYQSLFLFCFLFIITFGLYIFYWFYENWIYLKEVDETHKVISPGLSTFGLIVPVFNLVLLHEQFEAILEEAKNKGIETSHTAKTLILGFIFLLLLVFIYWPLFVLFLLIFVKLQHILNKLSKHDNSKL